ncbi:hypothetical protein [Paracoccus sp. SM22M-07]|uniref:hypothetical protein n=1 Tax=Paracoccus sp. SM22M-07 TaxID=1520813 RepID=UPI000916181C|nr:hypothetical protein [Paracoccus sp. SM22M-07]OJH45828.1 hypothetical protein IE00_00860 [Paracoccus sp. SM22M-07]
MITNKHLDGVCVELCKVENLTAALECLTDSMSIGGSASERMARDGMFGVIDALRSQVDVTRAELDNLIKIERETRQAKVAA